MKPKWTKEACIKDASNYQYRSDWSSSSPSAYVIARRKNWLKECCQHMQRKPKKVKWSLQKCMESASHFEKLSDWKASDPNAYDAATRNSWAKQCTEHMQLQLKTSWTLKACLESAQRYDRPTDWKAGDLNAYRAALLYSWIEECTAHMNGNIKWTKKKCIESALGYERPIDWRNAHPTAYWAARRHSWLNECYFHMRRATKEEIELITSEKKT